MEYLRPPRESLCSLEFRLFYPDGGASFPAERRRGPCGGPFLGGISSEFCGISFPPSPGNLCFPGISAFYPAGAPFPAERPLGPCGPLRGALFWGNFFRILRNFVSPSRKSLFSPGISAFYPCGGPLSLPSVRGTPAGSCGAPFFGKILSKILRIFLFPPRKISVFSLEFRLFTPAGGPLPC